MTWLRSMYVANILIAGPIGLANLLAPQATQALMGIPPGDPIVYGVGIAAIPLAFGLAGVLGLWFPLQVAPILVLQAGYKFLWLAGVLVPQALTGSVPSHAVPLLVIFLFFIVGDLIAVPFPKVFSKAPANA